VKDRFTILLSSLFAILLGLSIIPSAAFGEATSSPTQEVCSQQAYNTGWVTRENSKPGDSHWNDLVKHEKKGSVSGWFDQTSAACGDSVGLHLSGNGRPVLISIYRMGYYNNAKARLIFSERIGSVPQGITPSPSQDETHLTTANWPTTTTIHIDKGYPTGIYMARFDDGGEPGFAPLIIRNNASTSSLLMVAATLTWQAYNTWGGWSLYHGANPKIYSPGRIVSFDRPYDRDGKSNFTINDAGIVETAEAQGLDISYTDDIYVDSHPASLLDHKSIIYDGHPEYWTAAMRSAAFQARNSAVNLLFLGANSAYWRVRLENGGRQIVCWKGSPNDPFKNDPTLITNKWGQSPTLLNESELLGALTAGIGVEADYKVNQGNIWPLIGSGLKTGDSIVGVVGKEVETTDIGLAPAVQTFLSSRVEILGVWYNIHLTYYTNPSMSGVIDVGTNGWVCTITNTCSWKSTATSKSRSLIVAITNQILSAGANGPLALSHPEVSDIPARSKLEEICIAVCTKGTR